MILFSIIINLILGSFTCACYDGFYLMNDTCVANESCSEQEAQSCVNADCYQNRTGENQTEAVCVCTNGMNIE